MTDVLPIILFVLGVGFLIANVRAGLELLRWTRRRATALLVWPAPRPPYFGLSLAVGVMLGLLILFKAFVLIAPPSAFFGELMMFVYFGYLLPLSTRIRRGLFADGLWLDTGFMRYEHIGGISWKDEAEQPTLVVISRRRSVARRLQVPGPLLGEVRRLLREKISDHDIELDAGPGIHLGARDTRDSV